MAASAAPGLRDTRDMHTHGPLLLLALATLFFKSLIFAPISIWPLAFVCLTPWLVLVGCASRAPRVYFYSVVLGAAFFLINMRWMYPATGWGYLALSLYQTVYFPLMAIPVRSVIRRRNWPLAVVFPCVWVGGEILRAVVLSGFPWFFLSHGLYQVLSLIQVSDLVGAYGVSFVAATVNGAVADVIICRWRKARMAPRQGNGRQGRGGQWEAWRSALRERRVSVVLALALPALCIVYGQVRLRQNTGSIGPKVAVLQGDFVNTVEGDEVPDVEKRAIYFSMLDAAAEQQPDLFLLPETPWIIYLNPEVRDFFPMSRESFQAFHSRAQRRSAYIVTGSASMVPTPDDLLTKDRRYNSAMVFHPDGREPGRYDKNHLVYFGEVVPFRFGRFHSLYLWLNRIMPFSGPDGDYEYSLFPGDGFKVFAMQPKSQLTQTFRFGVPICYEDVMPYVSRRFTYDGGEKRVDFLLNISNDGWFGRGIQQPQHLAICAFRAVENRVGIARAVNTGVSAFIQPTGRIHDVVSGSSGRWPGAAGFAVANVGVDSRLTLYSRYGDWFAWGCALIWLALFIDYWVVRVREHVEH